MDLQWWRAAEALDHPTAQHSTAQRSTRECPHLISPVLVLAAAGTEAMHAAWFAFYTGCFRDSDAGVVTVPASICLPTV